MGERLSKFRSVVNGTYAVTRSAAAPSYSDLPRSFRASHGKTGVSVNEALGIGAAYRCVELLYTIGSSLDIDAIKVNRPLRFQPTLVTKPNLRESRSTTVGKTIAAMATQGEAFWYHPREAPGIVPAQITVLPPHHVRVLYDSNTDECAYERWTTDGFVRVPFWEISHLRLLTIPGYPHGIGPIQSARAAFQGALDLETYAGEWFNTTEIPEGVLSSDEDLSRDQAKRNAEMWAESRKEGRTAVLGKGLRYLPFLIKPEDAQFVENRKLSVVEVARLFGVPATLLDAPSGDSAVYSNQEQKNQVLLDYGLRRYLDEIEDTFSDLLPSGTTARFRTGELLRLNAKEQAAVDQIHIATGLRSVNEIRERDGLLPIDSTPAPAIEVSDA